MEGDSCSSGSEFESQHWILDGSWSDFFCNKIVLVFEKTENKQIFGQERPIENF